MIWHSLHILNTFSQHISHLLQQGRRAGEQFKLKNSVGTRTNGYQLAVKKLRMQFRRWFLIVRGRRSSNSLPNRGEDRKLSGYRTELDVIYDWDYRIWLPDPRSSCQFVTHFHCHSYNILAKTTNTCEFPCLVMLAVNGTETMKKSWPDTAVFGGNDRYSWQKRHHAPSQLHLIVFGQQMLAPHAGDHSGKEWRSQTVFVLSIQSTTVRREKQGLFNMAYLYWLLTLLKATDWSLLPHDWIPSLRSYGGE